MELSGKLPSGISISGTLFHAQLDQAVEEYRLDSISQSSGQHHRARARENAWPDNREKTLNHQRRALVPMGGGFADQRGPSNEQWTHARDPGFGRNGSNRGAFIIRVGFWGPLDYNYTQEPQK